MLIRGAYSSNIKERRDCSAALFDAAGRDGRPGRAHPRPPRRDARGGRRGDRARARARRRLDPQRPLPRRHPPAGHHARLPGRHRRRRSSATPSRARTTPTSAACAPARCPPTPATSGRRGSDHPAACGSSDDVLELILANVRTPDIRRGDLRAQIAANRLARAAARGARRAARARRRSSRRSRRCSPTPSGAPARRCARCPTASTRPSDATGGRRRHRRGHPHPGRRDGRRRRAADRLRRAPTTRWRGNVNCPLSVTRSACYFALRVLLPVGRPGQRRHLRGAEHRGARGLAWSTRSRPAAVVAGNVETIAARSPTPCSRRSPRPSTCPRRARAR